MVTLPDSKVLVIGPKWDGDKLNPWVYDVKKNTWSNKLTPDGPTIQALVGEFPKTSGICIENSVYMAAADVLFILDISSPDHWDMVHLECDHGIAPSMVSFSSTKMVILGGLQQDHTYSDLVTVVDLESRCMDNSLPRLSPEELGLTNQDATQFKDDNGNLMAFQIMNSSNKDGYRMSII